VKVQRLAEMNVEDLEAGRGDRMKALRLAEMIVEDLETSRGDW
jgi:hypothetical protein